jgi:hypothetical protein
VVRQATLTRLVDGSQLCVPRIVLDQEEFCAVEAGTERGSQGRRLHTVLHRKRARIGPYSVIGQLHERPGVTPLGGLRLSSPFVAVTDARIAFQRGASMEVRDVGTLLINGRQIAWMGEASNEPTDQPADVTSRARLADAI